MAVMQDIDVPEVIETVAKKLTQKTRLFNVLAIPTAKVPIVKFADRDTRLEGDISLYNTLVSVCVCVCVRVCVSVCVCV